MLAMCSQDHTGLVDSCIGETKALRGIVEQSLELIQLVHRSREPDTSFTSSAVVRVTKFLGCFIMRLEGYTPHCAQGTNRHSLQICIWLFRIPDPE